MIDLIVMVLVLAAVAGAALYVRKEKKKGNACIGCPNSGSCKGCH